MTSLVSQAHGETQEWRGGAEEPGGIGTVSVCVCARVGGISILCGISSPQRGLIEPIRC